MSWTGGNRREKPVLKTPHTPAVIVTSSVAITDDSVSIESSGDNGGSILDNITMVDPPQVGKTDMGWGNI